MAREDDKPLTPQQAREKLQNGLLDYLAGNDPGPIVFRLKRSKKANETYPLKLTEKQRETLLQLTRLTPNLKNKIKQAGEGIQVVGVTWNELDKLNDETGEAMVYATGSDRRRLMAVQDRVDQVLRGGTRGGLRLWRPEGTQTTPQDVESPLPVQDHTTGHRTSDLATDSGAGLHADQSPRVHPGGVWLGELPPAPVRNRWCDV